MKLILFLRSLCILLLSFSCLISASQLDNPYQGKILVKKQDENKLKQLALNQVLIKVSGNKDIDKQPETKALFSKLNTLLSQYGYENIQGMRYYTAVFDKHKINQALHDMQQPVWGDTRPTTLMWLISDTDNGRQLVSDNMVVSNVDNNLSSAIAREQANRGITLQFPLMDLDDNLAVTVSDVSGQFYEQIVAATERYSVNHFVVAQLQNNYLTWQLVTYNNQNKRTEVLLSQDVSGNKQTTITSMIDQIADYYAGQYAISSNQGEKLSQTIYVSGISSLAQLTQLNVLLANLLSVESYSVSDVDASMVTVNIKVNGGLDSFKNGLYAQPNLQADSSQSREFHFNWR